MMKINFRPFLFIFVCTVCGILFSLIAYCILPLGIALISLLCLSVFAFGVVYTIKKDYLKTATAVIAIAVLLFTAFSFLTVAEARKENRFGDEKHTVTGRVTEHYACSDGTFEAVLDGISVDGNEVSGKMSVYIYGDEDGFSQIRTGYSLTFTTELSNIPPIGDGEINASFVRSDIRYSAYVYGSVIIVPGQGTTLERIRLGLREHLVENMGEDAGSVAYGMIAGDRYLLSDEISDAFAGAGIGHILAVSGLHVGLIFLVINKLFSLIPVSKTIGRTATTLLLLLYALFTGGSPSTVRAVIMCLIVIWSAMFGKADSLNSLCLAATVCLCISPFYLFECGYLMSVGAVGGILMFSRTLTSALRKIRFPKAVAGSLAASVSVQIVITPITAYFFHRVYIYALPVNGMGMGLLSCLFFAVIAVLPFSFIFPVLLVPIGYVIRGLIFVCNAVCMLPLASVVAQVGAVVFILPVLLFFASSYVYIPANKYFSLLIFILCTVVGISSNSAVRTDNGMIATDGKTTATVIYNGDERYFFGDMIDGRSAASAIDRARIGNEKFIVYEYNLTEETAEEIVEFSRLRAVREVRFVYNPDISGLSTLQRSGIRTTMIGMSDGNVTVATSGGKPCGWLYSSGTTTVFIGQSRNYTSAMAAADIVRVKYAPFADSYPDKLFLSSRGESADNVAVTSFGHAYLYDFETGRIKAL